MLDSSHCCVCYAACTIAHAACTHALVFSRCQLPLFVTGLRVQESLQEETKGCHWLTGTYAPHYVNLHTSNPLRSATLDLAVCTLLSWTVLICHIILPSVVHITAVHAVISFARYMHVHCATSSCNELKLHKLCCMRCSDPPLILSWRVLHHTTTPTTITACSEGHDGT